MGSKQGNGSESRQRKAHLVTKISLILLLIAAGTGTFVLLNMQKSQKLSSVMSNSSVKAASSSEAQKAPVSSSADIQSAVASDWMNIRSAIGTGQPVVCSVPGKTKLELTGQASSDGTWVQVKTLGGKVGWCCRAFLDVDAADAITIQAPTATPQPLRVLVSLADQKVTVVDATETVVKAFTCSSGEKGSETPKGIFSIGGRGKSFYSTTVKEGGYYWTRFYGDFLFHSIPFDENYKIETEEAAKLGTAASHGCIRLALNDAKWIYEHIPDGTKVIIQ